MEIIKSVLEQGEEKLGKDWRGNKHRASENQNLDCPTRIHSGRILLHAFHVGLLVREQQLDVYVCVGGGGHFITAWERTGTELDVCEGKKETFGEMYLKLLSVVIVNSICLRCQTV